MFEYQVEYWFNDHYSKCWVAADDHEQAMNKAEELAVRKAQLRQHHSLEISSYLFSCAIVQMRKIQNFARVE